MVLNVINTFFRVAFKKILNSKNVDRCMSQTSVYASRFFCSTVDFDFDDRYVTFQTCFKQILE